MTATAVLHGDFVQGGQVHRDPTRLDLMAVQGRLLVRAASARVVTV
jgi:hypothetical protein